VLVELLALTLAIAHFGAPLLYYFYLKSRYLNKPWNIRVDESYKPKITIIVRREGRARRGERPPHGGHGTPSSLYACYSIIGGQLGMRNQ